MAVSATVLALGTLTGTIVPASGGNIRTVIVRNDGVGTLYIGGANVIAGTLGYRLTPSQSVTLDLWNSEVLYGVNSTTTGTITVLRTHE